MFWDNGVVNSKQSFLVCGIVFGLLAGCFPSSGQDLRYRMRVDYFENGKALSASTVNALRVAWTYSYFPHDGWKEECTLNGVALPIPTKDATIFALLDRQSGDNSAQSQCSIVLGSFEAIKWPLDQTWVERWNALAQSSDSSLVDEAFFPRFLAVKQGEKLSSGKVLTVRDLAEYGVSIQQISISITRETVSEIPASIKAFGCDSSTKLRKWTAEKPNCNSLITKGKS
jgi:hypothetical protein